jgi:IPT/TIG domain/Carboxypeptidase regulatory-like domain
MGAKTVWAYEGDLGRETRKVDAPAGPLRRARHLAPVLVVIMLAALVLGSFTALAVASPAVPAFDKYDGLSGQTPDSLTAELGTHLSPAARHLLGERFADIKAAPGMSSAIAALGTGSISGKVTNTIWVGIPAIVIVTDVNGEMIDYVGNTPPNGSYLITGLPNVSVKVFTYNESGLIDEWYNNVIAPGNWEGEGATVLNLATAPTRTGINFALAPGKTISGYVTNGSVGLAGVYVDSYDQEGNSYNYGETDAQGYFEIMGLPAGQYLISTDNDDGYVDEWFDNDPVLLDPDGQDATLVDVRTTHASNKNFVLSMGRAISGTVTDSTGTPLEDVEVRLQPAVGELDYALYEYTGAMGTYSFTGLPGGQYVVNTANDQGYVDEWYNNDQTPGDIFGWNADSIDVSAGDASGIDFALDPGHSISGSVTDNATGQAPGGPGMFVNIFNADGNWCASEFVDSETGSSYSTWALPAGTYYAQASDSYGSNDFALGSSYIDEWYDDLPCGQYRLADADPILLGAANVTGIDFGLARMAYYEQDDPRIAYNPAWTTFYKTEASAGSYAYSSARNASATFYFKGTRFDWIAMTGTTTGLAEIYINGELVAYDLDLSADPAAYQVKVWSSHTMRFGVYKVVIAYDSDNPIGERITLDALEIAGELVDAPPTVTALSPASGTAAGGTNVTITGTKFTGATEVHFGDAAATSVHVVSPTQVTCTTPGHDQGKVDVTVTTPGGTSSADGTGNDFTFTVPAPTVTGLSPATGPTPGGTVVTITGTYLTGATAVTFGGQAAYDVHVDSATQITATAPPHGAGTVDVTVTTPGGGTSSTAGTGNDYLYVAPVPAISELSPTSGTTSGGAVVIITGTGFYGSLAVSFGGVAGGITQASYTELKVVTPAHVAGTVEVTVTTDGGTSSTAGPANDYTFVAPVPAVTRLNPASGSSAGGTAVTLTGSGFMGASAVTFGEAAATNVHVVSPTQLTCTSPANAVGTVDVRVTTVGGTSSADGTGNNFTYNAAPVYTRYEQTDQRIKKTGSWTDYSKPGLASGNTYGRSLTSGASATIYFSGTRLEWRAMKGSTTGKVDVYLDGKFKQTVDLAGGATASYNVMVWSTGDLTNGRHSVRLVRSTSNTSTKYMTLDAVDIYGGTILSAPALYEQTDTHIDKVGVWSNFAKAAASGGSYGRSNTAAASATIYFTGTGLDLYAMEGTTTGIVDIYVDGELKKTINLKVLTAQYKVMIFSTGVLTPGGHNVQIKMNKDSPAGMYITLDAVAIWEGAITSAP